MLPTVWINAGALAEWMSYTRLDCPAGHKYSPLPVDNWWQKRWLAGSQANPVAARLEKKSLWHRNSLGPSPHSTQGQLFLQSDWIQFTSGDNHRCHRRHPHPLNGVKSLTVSAILAHLCEICASSKPHLLPSIRLIIDFTIQKCLNCWTSNSKHFLYLSAWTATKSDYKHLQWPPT